MTSTTLRNMASVTIRKLPNGVVKITGRKMAKNPYSRESKRGTSSFRSKLRKMERKGKTSKAKYLREKRRKEMGYSSWGIDNPRKRKR